MWFMDCPGSSGMSLYPSGKFLVPVLDGFFLLAVRRAVEHDMGTKDCSSFAKVLLLGVCFPESYILIPG